MRRPDRRAQLQCVTRETNKRIAVVDDLDHYGVDDVWVENPSDGKGDCEDFVLTKARILQQLGWSTSRMQLAVFGYGKQAHAVLVIDDTYVLDNLTPWVGRWKGYSPRAMGVYPIEVARKLSRFTPGPDEHRRRVEPLTPRIPSVINRPFSPPACRTARKPHDGMTRSRR